MRLLIPLDPASPVPLYHQIAETIRYRIATGTLKPGAVLPPLREAAVRWGANLHTVRRAYVELAREGLVATRVPQGTVVLARGAGSFASPDTPRTAPAIKRFLDRVTAEARRSHGVNLDRLVELLEDRQRVARVHGDDAIVHVAECSETQSADLAAQLASQWRVTAVPWPLGRPAPPGRGPIVATYFHYADVSAAWAERKRDVHFVGIHPDPALAARLGRGTRRAKRPISLTLCERDDAMLHNIAADLTRLLPPRRFRIILRLTTRPAAWLARHRGGDPVLFSPRLWGELPAEMRASPRVFEARYVFEGRELEALGTTLRWRPT